MHAASHMAWKSHWLPLANADNPIPPTIPKSRRRKRTEVSSYPGSLLKVLRA